MTIKVSVEEDYHQIGENQVRAVLKYIIDAPLNKQIENALDLADAEYHLNKFRLLGRKHIKKKKKKRY